MKIVISFLTSRSDCPETGALNPANGFADGLRLRVPASCRALFICSDPDGHARTDFYAASVRSCFEAAGFRFARFAALDGRNADRAAELVRESDLLILSGGHVPTQNRFFQRIGLKALLRGFPGVLMGISAGSMNSAETVYAQPELEGEALDPAYPRFLPGLGLTETMLLPHWQYVRDTVLDGLRVCEDITLPDSRGRTFFAIPDGTYLLIEDGRETLYGEAYRIRDGRIERIAADGDAVMI